MNQNDLIEELNKINIYPTPAQLAKIDKFYHLLIEWNKKINLTRITNKEDYYLKHVYDSLTIIKAIDLNSKQTLCDVGTGAGFPGIIIKIFYPHLKITLVDSLLKRINYLNEIIKELDLSDISAIHARGEDIKEKYDVVTSRAVANIRVLPKYTMHLVAKGGAFIALKGDIEKELTPDIKNEIEKKYLIKQIYKFELPIEKSKRSILVLENLK